MTKPRFEEQTFFIGNLHFDASESDLTKVFRDNGYRVGTTKVAREKSTGRSMGFGFVTVLCDNSDDLLSVMYGVEVIDRPIRVQVSTSARLYNDKKLPPENKS